MSTNSIRPLVKSHVVFCVTSWNFSADATLKQLLTSKVNSPLSLSFAELINQAQSCSSTASVLLRMFFLWLVFRNVGSTDGSYVVAMENNFVTILYHIYFTEAWGS